VHSDCLATSLAVAEAHGGWSARDETDWAQLFVELDRAGGAQLEQLGRNGQQYARHFADWGTVIERYEQTLASSKASAIKVTSDKGMAIHQFLPNLSYGDAISQHAILIRNHLRLLGYQSEIFVRFIDPKVANECHVFSPDALRSAGAVIYHHSIGSEITPSIIGFRGPKCLIYHNITPAEFVAPFRPQFAGILRHGREELPTLARHFPCSYGDSSYNVQELIACGFHNPEVLPICVDPAHWNFAPDPQLMDQLQDGRTNLLFVGRIAPNKKQDDLVRAFRHYLTFDRDARLHLVGSIEAEDPYADYLFRTIDELGLADRVNVTRNVSAEHLAAYYRTAHLFWSMSEHEGFCVPVIEAMWFDLPVLAYRTSAVPETLGQAALMFTEKNDPASLAALACLLVHDQALRDRILLAQRKQREQFAAARMTPRIGQLVSRLLQLQLAA
jgi:glycosyltransferase involved in cell wall biosynthesis